MKTKDDHYRFLAFYTIITLIISPWLIVNCTHGCSRNDYKSDTVMVEKRDTIIREVHDTIPEVKKETVLKYVTLPAERDTLVDSVYVTLPVVQKEYSDDSTYTAYVSGVVYEDYPKMDSIIVRQREITTTIKEVVTIKKNNSRWSIGLQAGYGIGLVSGKLEPYAGLGVGYRLP